MEDHFAQLLAIAEKEKLSEDDKALWRSFILCSGRQNLQQILAVAEERPGALLILTENIRRKIDIMRRGDTAAWTALIREEEMF